MTNINFINFKNKFFFLFALLIFGLVPFLGLAQSQDQVLKARVTEVVSQEDRYLPVTQIKEVYQTIKADILEGDKKGKNVTINDDYLKLKKGDTFYLLESVSPDTGELRYSVHDKYRLPYLFLFFAIFVFSVFVFGGIQGVRGLLSLIGSVFLIFFVLVPSILHGYSPILVTIGVSSLIIVLGSYVTHGFNKTTSSAVVGMIVTVLFTGVLAYFAVHLSKLSGFESEDAVYLNWNTNGTIDFVGLLFGGIMIGLLGVLYDVAIGQAVSVEELQEAGLKDRKVILKRVIRMGREHIGALVNTLAIAYVGAALPLLLLFYSSGNNSVLEVLNREVFATEIIRTLVGSIGLVLAVPITSIISTWMLVKKK